MKNKGPSGRLSMKRQRPNKAILLKDGLPTTAGFEQFGLKSYLEKAASGGYEMFFCRGEKCPRGPVSKKLSKHRCSRCVKGEEGEKLSSLIERIKVLNDNDTDR